MSDKGQEMWATFEAYQPTADADGHGESWRVMCKERTRDAALAAYYEAPRGLMAEAAAWAAWGAWAEAAERYAQEAIDALREVKP